MKKSSYNYLSIGKKNIIFNTNSGAIVNLSQNELEKYYSNAFSKDELQILNKQGLYVDDTVDELKTVLERRSAAINNTNELTFRVFTTSFCNANCSYCFERNYEKLNMSLEVAHATVTFINKCIIDTCPQNVRINWFGGEPLLNTNAIDTITKGLLSNNIRINYSMVSNCSLINKRIVKKMSDTWHIKQVQVTLDGFERKYNIIKNYNDKTIDFYRIIHNIHLLLEENIGVVIRLHYTGDNYRDLSTLIDYIESEFKGNRINVYLSSIWDIENHIGKVSQYSEDEFFRLMILLVEKGLSSRKRTFRLFPRYKQCMACSKMSFGILPDGRLIKCAECHTDVVGNIYEGITRPETNEKWQYSDLSSECLNCIYLPICWGGCRAGDFTNIEKCIKNKPFIDRMLQYMT